jgi:hypothetical protein
LFRLSPLTLLGCHVRWAPCQHGMVCPPDADGEDGQQGVGLQLGGWVRG